MLLSFLFIHRNFFVFPTLYMSAFHCSFFLLGMVLSFLFIHCSLCFCHCCLFVYDCVSLWLACCCLSFSSMVCFIYPIKTVAFCGICCTWVFFFGCAVVFFIPLLFILFTQSNELHFIVVFNLFCFVLASSSIPYSSTVPFVY